MVLGLLAAVTLLAMPAAAWGAETTTTVNGYSASPSVETTHTTATHAESTSSPATPKKESKPESKSEAPAAVKSSTETTTSTTASTLPFTGLNLAWVIGGGLLLLAVGVSTLLLQRRRANR
jgi:hypothetical protein